MTMLSRRSFLCGGVCVSALAALGYSKCVEPFFLQRSHYALNLRGDVSARAGKGDSIRILHLSDFHYESEMSQHLIKEACVLGLHAEPDIVVITGDLIDLLLPNPLPLKDILTSITQRAPTFVTLGNHDGGNWASSVGGYATPELVAQVASEAGACVLSNRSAIVERGGKPVQFVGLADLWSSDFSALKAFEKVEDGITTIVLSHNPDSKSFLAEYAWALMLCGHTHGGQLRIPWVGATPFAPVRDKRFVAGLNPWNERLIFTSTGIATTAHLRLNVRPEVTIFDLIV